MKILQAVVLAVWVAAAGFLRSGELLGTIPGFALPVALVLMAASVVLLAQKAPKVCEACSLDFAAPVPFALLLLGSFLLIGTSAMQFSQNTQNYLLLLEAAAGTVLLIHALAARVGKSLPADLLLVPVLAQVIRLIFTYREDAVNPDLSAYYVIMLATCATALALLQLASFYFQAVNPRTLVTVSAVTVVLSGTRLAAYEAPASALVAGGWALVFLAVLAAFRKAE